MPARTDFRASAQALRVLFEATTALNAAVTEGDVIRALAERATALCGAEFASIGLIQKGEFRYVQQLHHATAWEEVTYTLPSTGSILGRVIETATPYRCNDLRADPISDHAFDAEMGFRSQLTAPVEGRDHAVLGVVSLYNKRAGLFSAGDEVLLQTLAAQAAIALERSRSRVALVQREQRFRALVQHASDVIAVLDSDLRLTYVSPGIETMLGQRADDALSRWFDACFDLHPDDVLMFWQTYEAILREPASSAALELRLLHRDGGWRTVDLVLTNLLSSPGVNGIVVNFRDVTERQRAEAQLRHQAYHDDLTGLPNRALFLERLTQALARVEETGGGVAVLFLDLDRFKVINDSLGHVEGDHLLVNVARILATCVRPYDLIARLGGDEFTILIEQLASSDVAVSVAERIIVALEQPQPLHGREITISTSVGVAFYDRAQRTKGTPADLMREADIALYRAKAAGKATVAVFDTTMHAQAVARLELESELRGAIDRSELEVYYQPICRLDTGRLAGYEALVRWNHPQRGLILPDQFIPLAEETGLVEPLGRWVLRQACEAALCLDSGVEPAPVMSVNLSARQFSQADLVRQVQEILAETGLPAARLKLEITESTAMSESDRTVATLATLRALGVWLAIDDFGTGYSSMSYLKQLPIDTIKIDRAFVERLGQSPADAAIVRAIIDLGHALGLETTAEGIETRAQLELLRALGCSTAQGFYLGRPMPAADLSDYAAALADEPLRTVA